MRRYNAGERRQHDPIVASGHESARHAGQQAGPQAAESHSIRACSDLLIYKNLNLLSVNDTCLDLVLVVHALDDGTRLELPILVSCRSRAGIQAGAEPWPILNLRTPGSNHR